nr:gamma-butyrobetaine dioxygenase-like [Onthophagus taurus]
MSSTKLFKLINKSTISKVNFRFLSGLAKVSSDQESLVVNYDNKIDHFPLVWLRDNCRCNTCFHGPSQSRIINWNEFDVNVKVRSLQAKDENQKVEINWSDNHKSIYSFDWLKSRSFSKEDQEFYLKNLYIPQKKLWSNQQFLDVMKVYEYEDIMTKDEKFYNWLMDLSTYGVVLLKNAPKDAMECKKISKKIAFIKKTHYGEDYHIVAKADTNNVAYLSSPLQLHTDLPYYDYKPGVNMLHCIVQTKNKGGENLLSDGFYVAELLRKENKEAFDLLSQTEVNWSDIGEEDGVRFYKIHRAPVIS